MMIVKKRIRRILLTFSIVLCPSNGAFTVDTGAAPTSQWWAPSISASLRRPYYKPLYAKQKKQHHTTTSTEQKIPYRLGVYPYRLKEQQQQQQHDMNATTTLQTNTNHSTTTIHQQQDFILKQPKTLPSKIVDSFLLQEETDCDARNTTNVHSNHTITNATTMVNATMMANATSNGKTPTTMPKPKPSVLSPSQQFFSSWSYYDRKTKPSYKDSKKNTTSPIITKNPTDVLTVADLEEILKSKGYVSQMELVSSTSKQSTSKQKGKSVAFPQASVLSYKGLTIGSSVSAGILGMILGLTVAPNLWLIGILFGTIYGYEISKDSATNPPTNIVSRMIINTGRRLAKWCLKVYDTMYGIWFMYKTGQLSYDYYKQYAKLDARFGIQGKMDAWNARFIQGKKNFDAWERQNEIGRRVLAGFRTAWLVEEKRRKQTRYRIVQYARAAASWCRRFVVAVWDAFTGGGSSSLREVLKGIRINISESRWQEIGPRLGAAVMAIVTVSMVGSMYAIAPRFLGLLAIATGVIWPTWVPELWDRLQQLAAEFAATGRGEDVDALVTTTRSGIPMSLSQQFGLYDKKRYYYYQREDGSRRWYRTGQPAFRSNDQARTAKQKKKQANVKKNKRGSSASSGSNKGKSSGGNKPQWGWFS